MVNILQFPYIWIALNAHFTLQTVVVHVDGQVSTQTGNSHFVVERLQFARLLAVRFDLQHGRCVRIECCHLECAEDIFANRKLVSKAIMDICMLNVTHHVAWVGLGAVAENVGQIWWWTFGENTDDFHIDASL